MPAPAIHPGWMCAGGSISPVSHAIATTTGKAAANAIRTKVSVASGRCIPCMIGSMICSNANATTP
ncbi:MAG: hypothetical protein E6J88_03040 [Deltaproteobacteria bacterium]|nr:MAG: hypothetical protein E6J88_03040 [Deltaproteobacteria bacterium]